MVCRPVSPNLAVACRLRVTDERAAGLWLVPMYAALSTEMQAQAFDPAPKGLRKANPRSTATLGVLLLDASVGSALHSPSCRAHALRARSRPEFQCVVSDCSC